MNAAREARGFNFSSVIWLPQPPTVVFPFFSEALHLEYLTPPSLHFQVQTPSPIPMKVGTRIDYRLRLHGIPFEWQSEITEWDPPHGFVDEQRRGPYTFWIHAHRFLEREGGTVVRDDVRYGLRGGAFLDRVFVRRELAKIFTYRSQRLLERFGPPRPATSDPAPTAPA